MFNLLIGNEDNYRIYCKRTKGEVERKYLFSSGEFRNFIAVVRAERFKKILFFQLKEGAKSKQSW